MGTWCGDSKKEVPKLYKVLEACNFPEEQLTVIAVNRSADMYKQSPKHEEKGLNIHRVPTIIFYKDGKEINRIVEHPVKSFEKDIQNIVTVNTYKSNYQIVTKVNDILETKGLKGLKKQQKQLIKSFKDKVSSMYALNTYSRILNTTNKSKEAIQVLKLNTILFPNQPRAYMSLASMLHKHDHKKKAIKTLKKAIKRFPYNENLTKRLAALKSI